VPSTEHVHPLVQKRIVMPSTLKLSMYQHRKQQATAMRRSQIKMQSDSTCEHSPLAGLHEDAMRFAVCLLPSESNVGNSRFARQALTGVSQQSLQELSGVHFVDTGRRIAFQVSAVYSLRMTLEHGTCWPCRCYLDFTDAMGLPARII
jgi:hypothetical protein